MKKSERIEFRVTEEERAAYDCARTTPDGEIPLGAWIRSVLNKAVGAEQGPTKQLIALMRDCGIEPQIGLRQQGHLEAVRSMRADGKSWEEIAKAIGWQARAAEEWFAIESGVRED